MKHPKSSKDRGKAKSAQYDHLQGNPLDPANHSAASVPDATIPFSGEQLPGSPPVPGQMPFDDNAG